MSNPTLRTSWTSLLLVAALMAHAIPVPAAITDPDAVFTIPAVPRPGYMAPVVDPVFGSEVMRISNNTGLTTLPISGTWGADSRHTYSKQQPWNSDGTMLAMQNRSGGTPSQLILDGTTYQPLFTPCPSSPLYDYRWHPSPLQPKIMINVNSSGTELSWVDVTTCSKKRTWTLPITVDYGIGSGEGNPSNDGRFVALGNQNQIVVVDMDPQPPFGPYPNRRIGPVYTLPPCSLGTTCTVDNVSISASGKYVSLKFDNSADTTRDIQRIYKVDPLTLELSPQPMAANSIRPGSFMARPNGWIFPLKHHDLAVNPYDHNEDVAIGGNSSPGSTLGRVIMVRLRDGQVTELSDRDNEASFLHTSTRNIDRPGWVYVNYYKAAGKRFSDELVAVKMDGSKTVERLAHLHSSTSGCYRCEQHPVPSRDGGRVIFASNWATDCGSGCGPTSDIKDYVVLTASSIVGIGKTEPPGGRELPTPGAGLAVEVTSANPSFGLPTVVVHLPEAAPARLDLVDVAGRSVMRRELASRGPGRFEMKLGEERPAAGVYWLRLSQAGRTASSKLVILH